jgi:hypothetical protein
MEEFGSLEYFCATTLTDEVFTEDNLEDFDLTMVYFWATYDGYCIEDLEYLVEFSKGLPENIQIITVCCDGLASKDMAKGIVDVTNLEAPVLLDTESIYYKMIENIDYIPFTCFVDPNGQIVGDVLDYMPMYPTEDLTFAMNEALFAMEKTSLDGISAEESRENWLANLEVEDYLVETYDDWQVMEEFWYYYEGYGIPNAQYNELEDVFEDLVDSYNNDEIVYEELAEKLDEEVNQELREDGIMVPYASIDGLLDDIDGLTEEDREYILTRIDIIIGQSYYEFIAAEYSLIEDDLRDAFDKYDLNYDEVISQITGNNIQFAVYTIDGENVKYNDELRGNPFVVNDEDRAWHLTVIENIREIVPEKIWEQIGQVEFNTDGSYLTAAYVTLEDNEMNLDSFRLAIDVLDVIDENGEFSESGIGTIVHETGHILTLGEGQSKEACWFGMGDEHYYERYKNESYIFRFYNKFWLPTEDEFSGTFDQNDVEAMDEVYAYYDNHSKDFVSEYAATNVEEDMAESFMVFVLEDKPTGDNLADQKVLFYYEYPEFVEYRDQYRMKIYN